MTAIFPLIRTTPARPAWADGSTRRRQHTGAADRAYGALRAEILAGRLPLGARLREDELAAELRVSRTPVHEALLRLYGERLLARHRDGGFTPLMPSLPVACQLHELRQTLERSGLDRAALGGAAHDGALVQEIRERWSALLEVPPSPDEFVLEDERFHVDLAAASGNQQLALALETVMLQLRAVSLLPSATSPDDVVEGVRDHLAMIDAVAAGDLDTARTALDAHLDRSLEMVPTRVAGALVTMAAGHAS